MSWLVPQVHKMPGKQAHPAKRPEFRFACRGSICTADCHRTEVFRQKTEHLSPDPLQRAFFGTRLSPENRFRKRESNPRPVSYTHLTLPTKA